MNRYVQCRMAIVAMATQPTRMTLGEREVAR
ncbi:hypothetical protein C7408_105233 [Paraburkholderia caballeronis]|nr:hypothetical protein C7408_105233 [Paraburkholderia caballeronis]TDV19010.1 hypothetical protein C7406_104279 [Paraburkholderia caballeronis]TDV27143.1 hypothetical protein C7404_105233 [Paraburkholderia caballeronis]